jgi:Glycosyl transferases group 1
MNRILVFNFFAGVMDRGIPLYARDIATCMRRVGLDVIELRCPRMLRRAPRPLRNLFFALFEQIVAPAVRLLRGCYSTIYPYNSAGVIDAMLGRSVLVVHDLIPNHRSDVRLAARYIRITQAVHRLLSRPICAASAHTLAELRRLPAFRRCALQLWANPFYAFETALGVRKAPAVRESSSPRRVLLCSGMGRHKDYAGALKLFRRSQRLADAELRIVGFGDDAALAMRRVARMPEQYRSRIRVLPRLTLHELVEEYTNADIVWVHSRKEGFGRCVAEALLSHQQVIASDIVAFRRLSGPALHLYRRNGFDASIERAMSARAASTVTFNCYHVPLEAAVRELLSEAA